MWKSVQGAGLVPMWWWKELLNHRVVHLPRVEALPDSAEKERQIFEEQGIRSLLQWVVFLRVLVFRDSRIGNENTNNNKQNSEVFHRGDTHTTQKFSTRQLML